MGLFEKIFRPSKNKDLKMALDSSNTLFKTLTAYQPVFTNWKGKLYEALMIRTAIDARARYISKLKVTTSGSAKPDLQSKLSIEPNEWMTYSQFLYRVSTILDVCNTAFIVPVYDKNMIQQGYFPVLPTRCQLVEHKDKLYLRYTFLNNQTGACEFNDAIVLTKFQFEDDFFGADNKVLNDTLDLIHIQNQGIKEAVRNSATYRFMAQVSNFTFADDLAKERERFSKENFSSESKSGGLLLFPNTYSNIQQLKNSPYIVDDEQMKLINENINSYFGVNENILYNKASVEDLDAFYKGAVEPFAIQFSEAMTKALFTHRERILGNKVVLSSNRFEFLSTKEKVDMARELGDRGVIKINEVRELFGYPPLPNGAGEHTPIRGEYYFSDLGKGASQEYIEGENAPTNEEDTTTPKEEVVE